MPDLGNEIFLVSFLPEGASDAVRYPSFFSTPASFSISPEITAIEDLTLKKRVVSWTSLPLRLFVFLFLYSQ